MIIFSWAATLFRGFAVYFRIHKTLPLPLKVQGASRTIPIEYHHVIRTNVREIPGIQAFLW